MDSTHATLEELGATLDSARRLPTDEGRIALIVVRPQPGVREVLESGELTIADGLRGDSWNSRESRHTPDRSPSIDMQLTLMSTVAAALIAGDQERWPLAGDQFFVDLDLSEANLPAGSRLTLGSAEIEISRQPHTGCGSFANRFGVDAVKFVNTPEGRQLRLRGANARVVRAGVVKTGDMIARTMAPR